LEKKFSSLHAMMTFSAALRSNNNFRPLFLNAPRCGEDSDSNNRRRRIRRRRGEVDVTKSGGGGSGGGDAKRRDFLLLSSSFIAATTTTTTTTLFDYSSSRAKAKAATEGGGGGENNDDDADEFQSPLVKALLKQTEENKSLRKLQMETKYCLRQSQLGVGDCADIDEETILKIQKERAEKLKMKEKEGTERETED
jgi:hypothetical protein